MSHAAPQRREVAVGTRPPGAPLTRDQIALMRRDNVASRDLPGLRELGVSPAALEDVVPAVAAGGRGGST